MLDASDKLALRNDPATHTAIAAWRRLTGGRAVRDPARKTLIALSGGCDSSALLLALASASTNLVAAHIVHDLRPPAESLADRDAARALATRLEIPFVESQVHARPPTPTTKNHNLEAAARRLRYAALAQLAHDNACSFLATAHHADDLLETILMRLLRGTGPTGLAPIRPRRRYHNLTIIRPLLTITREDTQRLCNLAHHTWATDATNADTTRLRNALRADVIPHLKRIAPLAAQKAATTSELLAHSADLIRAHARKLLTRAHHPDPANPTTLTYPRATLAHSNPAVLGELLRIISASHGHPPDRLPHRVVAATIRAIQEDPANTNPRHFTWSHLHITVHASLVTLEPT